MKQIDVEDLEQLKGLLRESDPLDQFSDYLSNKRNQAELHERIMQGVMAAPPIYPKKKRRGLSKLYSGLGLTLKIRKQLEKI